MAIDTANPVFISRQNIYNSSAGYFGWFPNNLTRNAISWFSCREEFHELVSQPTSFGIVGYPENKIKSYLFNFGWPKHPETQSLQNVNEFIEKVEDILGIKSGGTIFQPTIESGSDKISCLTFVTPSPWWLTQPMRHQFFTCCLRASMYYKFFPTDSGFYQTLFEYVYFKPTIPAVCRFLDGHTHYTGTVTGWYKEFHNKVMTPQYSTIPSGALEKLLVKPS